MVQKVLGAQSREFPPYRGEVLPNRAQFSLLLPCSFPVKVKVGVGPDAAEPWTDPRFPHPGVRGTETLADHYPNEER
jgi:hypothetical protein